MRRALTILTILGFTSVGVTLAERTNDGQAKLMSLMHSEQVSVALLETVSDEIVAADGIRSSVQVRLLSHLGGPELPGVFTVQLHGGSGRHYLGRSLVMHGQTLLGVMTRDGDSDNWILAGDHGVVRLAPVAIEECRASAELADTVQRAIVESLVDGDPVLTQHLLRVLWDCCGTLEDTFLERIRALAASEDLVIRSRAATLLYWQGDGSYEAAVELLAAPALSESEKTQLARAMTEGPELIGLEQANGLFFSCENESVRRLLTSRLSDLASVTSVAVFVAGLELKDDTTRHNCTRGLARILQNEIEPQLIEDQRATAEQALVRAVSDSNSLVARTALETLAGFTAVPVFEQVIELSTGSDPALAAAALAYRLERLDMSALEPAVRLFQEWDDPLKSRRLQLARVMEDALAAGVSTDVAVLNDVMLKSQDSRLSRVMAVGLEVHGDASSGEALVACLASEDTSAVRHCLNALTRISGTGPGWTEYRTDPASTIQTWQEWLNKPMRGSNLD